MTSMVRVDFTIYPYFDACPDWWKNFIVFATNDFSSEESQRSHTVDELLAEEGIICVDHPTIEGDLLCLVAESQQALDQFKTYWTLRGNSHGK